MVDAYPTATRGLTPGDAMVIHLHMIHARLIVPAIAVALAIDCARALETPPPLTPLPKIPKELESPAAEAAAAPADVVASAVDAVTRMGEQIVLGRYQIAIDRMNPAWKERAANRVGGMAELEKQLAAAPRVMVQQGVSIISFKPLGKPSSFEVGKKVERAADGDGVKPVLNEWLVFVPTVTRYREMLSGGKSRVTDRISFQVAVSEKGKNDWTFIAGANLTINDLRGLYFTLPADLQFPPVETHEVR